MITTATAPDLRSLALDYLASGLSLVPCSAETKRPDPRLLPRWKCYQKRPPDEATVRGWFERGCKSVAAIGGAVSGGLLILDFDAEGILYAPWCEAVGNLADGLPVQRTGGGGYQVALRCPEPGRNKKLAYIADPTKKGGRTVAIETRAEGGYAILPGSLHPSGRYYEAIACDFRSIPFIPQSQADALLAAACRLDGTTSAESSGNGKMLPLDRCWRYVQKMDDAISGSGGHNATFAAACECFRFGLSDSEAAEIMRRFNATKTGDEQWTAKELTHKLDDARQRVLADREFGLRLDEGRAHSNGNGSHPVTVVVADPDDDDTDDDDTSETAPEASNGRPADAAADFIPTDRRDMFAILNSALVGKFGGRVNVVRVEKIGATKGVYVVVAADGQRVELGTVAAVMSPGRVREAIADQTRVLIPLAKKTWPRVANAIIRLAEIVDVGRLDDQLREWLEQYVEHCRRFFARPPRVSDEAPAPWSREWKASMFPRFGTAGKTETGCLPGPAGELYLHLESFFQFLADQRARILVDNKSPALKAGLLDLGFATDEFQLKIDGRVVKRRAWKHDSWLSKTGVGDG